MDFNIYLFVATLFQVNFVDSLIQKPSFRIIFFFYIAWDGKYSFANCGVCNEQIKECEILICTDCNGVKETYEGF